MIEVRDGREPEWPIDSANNKCQRCGFFFKAPAIERYCPKCSKEVDEMIQSQTTGRIDPLLKARIDWMQKYIDTMQERYDHVPADVLVGLYNKKQALVERV